MSYDDFCDLIEEKNDEQIIKFLVSVGLIANSRVCIFCGGDLRKKKGWTFMVLDFYPTS